jgi:pimeloyl-ACP methyl ester carboxylesterase
MVSSALCSVRSYGRFFADVMIDLLDALELDRADIIGNSLGGRVALEVALREPERVGRLALLAPASLKAERRGWSVQDVVDGDHADHLPPAMCEPGLRRSEEQRGTALCGVARRAATEAVRTV